MSVVKGTLKTLGTLGGIGTLYVAGTEAVTSRILIGGATQNLVSSLSENMAKVAVADPSFAGLTFGGFGAIPLGLSVALAWVAYNKSLGRLTAKVGRIKVTKDDQDATGEALKAGTITPKQRKYLEQCYRIDIKKRQKGPIVNLSDYFGVNGTLAQFKALSSKYVFSGGAWTLKPGKTAYDATTDIPFLTAISPDGQVKWSKSFYIKRAIEMRQTVLSGGASFLAPEKKWQRTAGKTTSYIRNVTKATFTGTLTGCSVAMAASILGSGAPMVMAGIVAFPFMCKAVKGTWTTANLLVNRGIKAPRIR